MEKEHFNYRKNKSLKQIGLKDKLLERLRSDTLKVKFIMEILKISEDMAKVIYFSMMAVNTKVNLIKVN